MDTVTLTIGGMSCQHCVRAVREALESVPGVQVKRVDVGTAEVDFEPADTAPQALLDAVTDAGYEPVVTR